MVKTCYALTISRAKLDKKPTKNSILTIRNRFYDKFKCNETNWPVNAFELKKNGWLHYHSTIFAPYIIFTEVIYPGWHFKLAILKTMYDNTNWCGYVQKFKIDKVDISYTIKKVVKFKKDKQRMSYIPHISHFSKWLKTESDTESESDKSASPCVDTINLKSP